MINMGTRKNKGTSQYLIKQSAIGKQVWAKDLEFRISGQTEDQQP